MKEHIHSFHMKYSSLLSTHRLQNYRSYKALYVFALVDKLRDVGRIRLRKSVRGEARYHRQRSVQDKVDQDDN